MNIFKDKKDPAVKYAVMQAHKRKCLICTKDVPIGDVDHYIPKYLKNKPEEFKKIKSELNLPSEFTIEYIDSYHNLVWACKPCNQILKRAKIPDRSEWQSRYYYIIKPLIKDKEEIEKSFRLMDKPSKIQYFIEENDEISSLLEFKKMITEKISMLSESIINKLNSKINSDFPILKERFFPNSYLNIALSIYDNKIVFFSFPIKDKQKFIEATRENYEKFNSPHTSALYSRKREILVDIDEFINEIIFSYVQKLFSQRLLKHSDVNISIESLFFFNDKWYPVLYSLPDDSERPEKIDLNEFKNNFLKIFPNYKNCYTEFTRNSRFPNGHVCINLFFEMIEYLETMGIKNISRPYKLPNKYTVESFPNDYVENNLSFLFSNLIESYTNLIDANFPFLRNYPLPRDLDIDYLFEIKEPYYFRRMKYWGLKKSPFGKIYLLKNGQIVQQKKNALIHYSGLDYEIIQIGSMGLPEKSALISKIYDIIFQKIKDVMKKTSNFIRFDEADRFW